MPDEAASAIAQLIVLAVYRAAVSILPGRHVVRDMMLYQYLACKLAGRPSDQPSSCVYYGNALWQTASTVMLVARRRAYSISYNAIFHRHTDMYVTPRMNMYQALLRVKSSEKWQRHCYWCRRHRVL